MVDIFISVLSVSMVVVLAIILIIAVKNQVTYVNYNIILDAIFQYHKAMIDVRDFNYKVDYEDIEPYEVTLRRWTDWGYKNILPEDKFKIIEPYIQK